MNLYSSCYGFLAAAAQIDAQRMMAVVVSIAVLAGVVKCMKIMRRPTTNTACVLSLMIALLSWVIRMLWSQYPHAELSHPVVVAIYVLLIAGLAIAGLVLAIVGLAQYARQKERFRQGRHQAIWGILLNGLILGLLVTGVFVRALRTARARLPQVAGAASRELEFPEFNFRMRAVDKPWVEVDMKRLNADATVGFRRLHPEVYFTVIAERTDGESGLDTDFLAAISEANVRQAGAASEISDKTVEIINGVRGLRFLSAARVDGQDLAYSHWVAVRGGYAWQLIAWGLASDADEVRRAAAEFSRHFELLDSTPVSPVSAPAAADVHAPNLGYSLPLAGTGWRNWTKVKESLPEAHSGARLGTTSIVAVIPLWLDGFDPSEAELQTALLASIGMVYPGEEIYSRSAFTQQTSQGYVYRARRTSTATEFDFQIRALRNERFAYLLVGWCLPSDDAQADRDAALDRIVLLEDATTGGRELGESDRRSQGLLFEYLAQAALAAGNVEHALSYYQRAFAYRPEDAELADTVASAYDRLERYADALAFIDEHIERFPDNQQLLANRAYQLARVGRGEEATAICADLFDRGYDNEFYLAECIEQLKSLGRFDDAHRVLDGAIQRRSTEERGLLKAQLFFDEQAFAEAIATLRDLQVGRPFSAKIGLRMLEYQHSAGHHRDALETAARLIDNGQATAYAHYLKGGCELQLEQNAQAKDSFTRAVELDPANEEYRRHQAYAAGLLGQGDNSLLKEPLTPVELPPSLATRLSAGATASGAAAESAAVIEAQVTGVEFRTDDTYKVTHYHVARPLTADGVAAYNTIRVSVDPLVERIHVNRLEVRNTAGEIVATGDPNTYYALDDTSSGTAQTDKIVHLPVPGLEPGFTLDYAVTIQYVSPPRRWPYREHLFLAYYPTRFGALLARGELEHLAYETSDDITVERDAETICWTIADQPAYRWEPLQAPYDTWMPTVAFGDRRETWTQLSADYLDELAKRLELDDETRAVAAELTRGLSGAEEAMAALVRHVQREYSYTAIEFGRRARVPNPAADTLRNRYGDCKDHALLLHQLLHAAGQECHLALLNTRGDVRPGLPSLDQFDHMVVYVPDVGEFGLIDATAKSSNLVGVPLLDLADRHFLILDPAAPRIERTGTYPSDATRVQVERTVEIVDSAHAAISEELVLGGAYAAAMRGALQPVDSTERRAILQRQLDEYNVSQLQIVDIRNLDALEEPLELSLRYQVHDVFHAVDGNLVGTLPATWDSYYFWTSEVSQRYSPFEIQLPFQFNMTVHVNVPEGYALIEDDRASPRSAGPYLNWHVELAPAASGFDLTASVARHSGSFPTDRYDDYCAAIRELRAAIAPKIVLRGGD